MMRRKSYYYKVRLIADTPLLQAPVFFVPRMPSPYPPPLSNRLLAPGRLPRKVLLLKTGEYRPLLEIGRIV